MSSDSIRARMRQVREAISVIRSAGRHVQNTKNHSDRLVAGAGRAVQSVTSLIGGASSGADREMVGQLTSAADGGKRFSSQLLDAQALMQQRIARLEEEYEALKEELQRALQQEAAARAAARRY